MGRAALAVRMATLLFISSSCVATDPMVTDKVYLTVAIDGKEAGKIVIGLFGEIVPKTVRNFVELATHENGYGYRGSAFHRVARKYYVLGGAFKYGNKSEGTSIYGRYFEHENFELKHYGKGWVSMANAGPDKNGSQFYIVTYPLELFDNRNVVFGKVLRGMHVVRKIQALAKSNGERPPKSCDIIDSGSLSVAEPFAVSKDDSPYDDPVAVEEPAHSEL